MSRRSPYKVPNGTQFAPEQPSIYCEVSVREVSLGYRCLIAEAKIPRGTIIARDGGTVVTSIEDVLPEKKYAVLIDDGLWLALNNYDDLDALSFMNHSCESNVARIGGLVYFAKADIAPGDELTIDYAALASNFQNWTLQCGCGSKRCRKTVTSLDWQNPLIAKELWNEWLPFIQKKILEHEGSIETSEAPKSTGVPRAVG